MRKSIFFSCLLLLLTTACVRSASTQPAALPVQPSPEPTRQPLPSTATVEQPPRPTDPPQAMPTFEAASRLENPRIQRVGFIDVGILIVVIENDAPPQGDYRAVIGDQDFQCTLQEMFPNNLYCSGPQPEDTGSILVEVYPAGGNELYFSGEAQIPAE